jgi:4-hydroxy-3-methylbut-2-en-1-yl diphosphate synthase IspG/GcpE
MHAGRRRCERPHVTEADYKSAAFFVLYRKKRERYAGVEELRVAVMCCIVNGPG